jgi:hypothetical protein
MLALRRPDAARNIGVLLYENVVFELIYRADLSVGNCRALGLRVPKG